MRPMPMPMLIVGASTAGIRTAQMLRRQGFAGELVVIGQESHLPYDKPPLSKDMLERDGAATPTALLTEAEYSALAIDLRLGVRAVGLDVERRCVEVADGTDIDFDQIVIATGLVPRSLPGADALGGIYTIRDVVDAVALRNELADARRVVVIGAGFIGSEFASAARRYGVTVDIVEAQDIPMAHLFGPDVGRRLSGLHARHGASVHTGAVFAGFLGTDRVSAVQLKDGRVLPADIVVVGIGARPATDWLEASGLPIDDGVLCDRSLRVHGCDGVYAAGDVARWPHPLYDTPVRIEHWTNANEHAAIVAAAVLGAPAPTVQPPYVWSDQHGERIQVVGRPSAGRPTMLRDPTGIRGLVAVYVDDATRIVGAVVVGDPRLLMKLRKAVAGRLRLDEVAVDLEPVG
jgi:NADPH-dependent 2,4-dienoyl-CoA reductase/sulfur reductase-like enzyme